MMPQKTISRRTFLAQSGLAAGGWMLLPALAEAREAADPDRFVLMADTHVCGDRTAVERNCNPDETCQQAVERIRTLKPRPAGVIIAGDCVYLHGLESDYAVLKELLRPLRKGGIPVLLALGNHDNREHFSAVFPDARIADGPALKDRMAAVIETPHADWYLLDSLEKTNYTPGRFGEEQLAWLAAQLDKRPEKPALMVAHHYPRASADDNGLVDTEAFMKIISPRKQAKCYFYGHSHAWSQKKQEDGLHLVNIPANAWLFNEAQPRGFVDAQMQADGVTLTLHCLDQADTRHGETHKLNWRE